jgi:fumarate reductase flavoprotein subunit
MSHLGPADVARRFSGMVKRCADSGFDLAAGKVEVVPTAHYFMGGLVCDPDTRTDMPGLYVAGEDAGGAHGSNRLGGNGVANSTVYGGVAGDIMAADAAAMANLRDPDRDRIDAEIERARHPFTQPAGDVHGIRERLMNLMWDDVGIMRTAQGLERGMKGIADLKEELMHTGLPSQNTVFNLTWHDWINVQNLITISEAIALASMSRENSRGAHYREEFPEEGDLDTSYFTVVREQDGAMRVDREPVEFTIVKPGESLVEDMSPVVVDSAA